MVASPLEAHVEADLVARAQRGDGRALDELIRAHRPRIVAICRRVTNSESDAQDAAQDACVAIMRHLRRFDGKSSFGTWVYRVATNASLDELRRRGRRPIATDFAAPPADGARRGAGAAALLDTATGATRASSLSRGATGDGSVDSGFDERIAERLRVDAALAALPEEFRVAVVLRDLCDLDYAEIATVLGVPIGTVRSRIARGRAALVKGLPEQDQATGNQSVLTQRQTTTTAASNTTSSTRNTSTRSTSAPPSTSNPVSPQ